jgi:hypothetical protein
VQNVHFTNGERAISVPAYSLGADDDWSDEDIKVLSMIIAQFGSRSRAL